MTTNETFDLTEGLKLLHRNAVIFAISLLLCGAIAITLGYTLPKQFKSKAILNIQTSYFQNPMVNDLITEVSDPQELQSQRLSLLRLALDNTFIDSLANKYGLYTQKTVNSTRDLILERELLTQRIQYYSMNPTTFEVTVTANDGNLAQALTSEVLERMKSTLIKERYENLVRTKGAIEAHVKSLGDNIHKITTPTGEVALQTELAQVEATLAGLLVKFTESHPEVQKMRSVQRGLQTQKQRAASSPSGTPSNEVIARGGNLARQPSQEVYSELLKKLNYLAIVLDMEKDKDNLSYLGVIEQPTLPVKPYFPNKRLLLALGLVIGVFLGIFLSLLAELSRRSVLSPAQAAETLDAPLLGELPELTLLSDQHFPALKALPAGSSEPASPQGT